MKLNIPWFDSKAMISTKTKHMTGISTFPTLVYEST